MPYNKRLTLLVLALSFGGLLISTHSAKAGFGSILANVQGYCWSITGTYNFSGCNDTSGWVPDGCYTASLDSPPDGYYLAGVSGGNSQCGGTVSWYATFALNPPPSTTISADQTTVTYGGSTTIRWSSSNASYCNTSFAGNGLPTTSTYNTGAMTSSQSYTVACYNSAGVTDGNKTATVSVGPQGSINIELNPTSGSPKSSYTASVFGQCGGGYEVNVGERG